MVISNACRNSKETGDENGKNLLNVGKAEEHLMRSKALVRLVQPLVNALGKVVENHLIWTKIIRKTTVTHITEVMPR